MPRLVVLPGLGSAFAMSTLEQLLGVPAACIADSDYTMFGRSGRIDSASTGWFCGGNQHEGPTS